MTHTYLPEIYNVRNQEEAKNIILTPQAGLSTDDRWLTETPHLMKLIEQEVSAARQDIRVLDYGCGIGRLSRAMIEKYNAHVLGIDISWSMRALAIDYTKHDNFLVGSPKWLDVLADGRGFHMGLAVWVLQHCPHPEEDIRRIALALQKQGGSLFVVNEKFRVVPVRNDRSEVEWANDGIDIRNLLHTTCYEVLAEGRMDPKVVGEEVSANTFWGVYRF